MSQVAIKYAQRDLETVEKALPLVKGRQSCVQAGACLGVYPQFLARHFKAVYAFEPDPALFRKAVTVPPQNIVWFNAALGHRRELVGTACTRRDGSTRPVHEGLTHISGAGIIPTLCIDDLGLTSCDLICLDIEGREFAAVQGAKGTITQLKPVVILEINKQLRYSGITEDDLRSLMRTLGYDLRFRSHSDEVYTPCR